MSTRDDNNLGRDRHHHKGELHEAAILVSNSLKGQFFENYIEKMQKLENEQGIQLTTPLASRPPQSRRRPSDRALAVAYLWDNETKIRTKISPIFMNYQMMK